MIDTQQFNSAQLVCSISGKKPRLHYTGIHVIACCLNCACSIHDANASSTEPIINAWNQLHPSLLHVVEPAPPTTKPKPDANELYPRFTRSPALLTGAR